MFISPGTSWSQIRLRVIGDAMVQATAEREARRIGLGTEYRPVDDFLELQVTGEANQLMRDFFRALNGFGISGRTVDVDTPDEQAQLGDSTDGHEVCLIAL